MIMLAAHLSGKATCAVQIAHPARGKLGGHKMDAHLAEWLDGVRGAYGLEIRDVHPASTGGLLITYLLMNAWRVVCWHVGFSRQAI